MAETKTIRQQIVEAARDMFTGIRLSAGFKTDLGARLTIWNVTPITDRELEGIDLRDTTDDYDEKITRHVDHKLRIDVEMHAKKEGLTAAYLRNGIADINQALGLSPSLGGLAIRARVLKDEMIIDKTSKIVGGVQVQVEITYRTGRFNQFSQSA